MSTPSLYDMEPSEMIPWGSYANGVHWPAEDVRVVGRSGYFTVTMHITEGEHPKPDTPAIRLDGAGLRSGTRAKPLAVVMKADGMTDFENDSTNLCRAEIHPTYTEWDDWSGYTINGVLTSLLLWTPFEAQQYAEREREGAYMPRPRVNGFETRWGAILPTALSVQVRVTPRVDAPWPEAGETP